MTVIIIITGDMILQMREVYKTTPLHLYALTERLKLPEPTCGKILTFV